MQITPEELTGTPQTLINRTWLDADTKKPVKTEDFWTGLEDLSDAPPQYTQEDIDAAEAELARAEQLRKNPPAPKGVKVAKAPKAAKGAVEFSVWIGNTRTFVGADIFAAEVEFKKVKKASNAKVMKGEKELGHASFSSMCSVARKASK